MASHLAVPHERIPVEQIHPAAYNPRAMGKVARAGLEQSLKHFGLVEPPVWNKRTGNLVGGHQRFQWLTEQGAAEVDCVVVDLSDEDERALNVALNHRAISGHFTKDVRVALEEIRDSKPDLFAGLRLKRLSMQFKTADESLAEAVGSRDKPKGCCPRCGTPAD